jgi:hypothetical protein
MAETATKYLHLGLGSDAIENANWEKLDQKAFDLARALIADIPAGGDLQGFYPDPTIRNEAVTSAAIADGAVTFPKMAPNSVGVLNIVNGAVDRAKLAPNCWPNPIPTGADVGKILTVNAGPVLAWATPTAGGGAPSGPAGGVLTGTYPNPGLATNAVQQGNIFAQAVSTSKLEDGAVTYPKIAPLAVARDKCDPSCWLSPIPTGADVAKVLTVQAGPTLAWATPTGGGGGIPEAPLDSKLYGRKNAAWVEAAGGTATSLWIASPTSGSLTPDPANTVSYAGVELKGTSDGLRFLHSNTVPRYTGVRGDDTFLYLHGADVGVIFKTKDDGATLGQLRETGALLLPGTDPNTLVWGSRTAKGRLYHNPSGDVLGLRVNATQASVPDDATLAGWNLRFNLTLGVDAFSIDRTQPSGGGGAATGSLLTLANTGLLSIPAVTATGAITGATLSILASNAIAWGATVRGRLIHGNSTKRAEFTLNMDDLGAQDDVSLPSYRIRLGSLTDDIQFNRQAPGPGAVVTLAKLAGDGAWTWAQTAAGNTPGLTYGTGSSPAKFRIGSLTGGNFQFYSNATLNNLKDDPSLPSLAWVYDAPAREFGFYGAPAGGTITWSQMLALHALGVTIPNGHLAVTGGRSIKARLHQHNNDQMYLTTNYALAPALAQDDPAAPSWAVNFGGTTGAESFRVRRAVPGSTTLVDLLSLTTLAQLTVAPADPGIVSQAAHFQYSYTNSASQEPIYGHRKARLNGAPILSGDYLGTFECQTAYATNTYGRSALLLFQATENHTASARGTNAQIWVNAVGSVGLTSVLTFDSSGNLTITGAIGQKSTGTTWSNPSDRRLKDEIADYLTGLDVVLQLQPRTFVYNGKGGSVLGMRGYGFIADEVAAVRPEMVGTTRAKLAPDDEDLTDIQTVDQSNLILALVNAIKELTGRVVALEGAN